MRITIASTAKPSTAHMACRCRKKEGPSYRSIATTAEALQTITMLSHTGSRVEMNSTLSDLSFLATCHLGPEGPSFNRQNQFVANGRDPLRSRLREGVLVAPSGQQSSDGSWSR